MTSCSESDPLLSSAELFRGDLDVDLSGVGVRFPSEELCRALAEASESAERERLLPFFASSSSEDSERLPLPPASLFCGDSDDEELLDELLDSDFLLFLPDDFSDAEEASLFVGDADCRLGEGGGDGGFSSCSV